METPIPMLGARISVVVPIYKVESYLCRCIDSLLAQTYRDFELILVDDGSPDRCGEICDEYAKQDARIVVIHQKNGGLSAARNAGIDWTFAHSSSEYIAFIDSDDWVSPNYLEELCRGVCMGMEISCAGTQKVSSNDEAVNEQNVHWKLMSPEVFWLNEPAHNSACGKLYRRELFRDIRYPVGRLFEDQSVTYKLLFAQKQIAVTSARLYQYFVRNDGITASAWKFANLDVLDGLRQQQLYFTEHGYQEPARRAELSLLREMGNAVFMLEQQIRVGGRSFLRPIVRYRNANFIRHPLLMRVIWPFVRGWDKLWK